jgi:catechol 2,3-dioxygenase-like lactoylglutathione lyase family enzyme
MTARLAHLTFDAADPPALAAFWSDVLGRPVDPDGSDFFTSIGMKQEPGPSFFFIKVPEGRTAKNRCHPDLDADDREAEVIRLLGLGAERVSDHDEYGARWTVLRDPAGNEFCVAGP